jgi:hypothetical protein
VLLVGDSCGGAVISVAGASTPSAVGLVYVAAFALDEGESFGEIFGRFGETPLVGAVRASNYPLANGETAVELTIAPELYREAFAADLSDDLIERPVLLQRRSRLPRPERDDQRERPDLPDDGGLRLRLHARDDGGGRQEDHGLGDDHHGRHRSLPDTETFKRSLMPVLEKIQAGAREPVGAGAGS